MIISTYFIQRRVQELKRQADIFVKIKNLENLKYVLKIAKNRNLPLTIIGNGSNVLVKDNGIRGIVIKLEMNDIQVLDNQIIVDAGATLTKICKVAKENELSGLEFAYGIPGTIGGAIVMNAGAYGGEMKSIVSKTTYMNDNLEVKTISKEEHNFSYRTSIFSENKSLIIISTVLEMTKGSKEDISNQMKQNINSRIEKQPVDFACIFIFASSYDSYPNIAAANDSNFLSSRISTERIIKFRISSEVLSDNSSNSFTVATIIL